MSVSLLTNLRLSPEPIVSRVAVGPLPVILVLLSSPFLIRVFVFCVSSEKHPLQKHSL